MTKEEWKDIKQIVINCFAVAVPFTIMFTGAVLFGLSLRDSTAQKKRMESLRKENLILDNELKELQILKLKRESK